ncbi:MAG: amino acid permease [Deltaproteobacteria bacterium SG8_13]|nr:MAG: amino acid permease [Deltaproteobacteria bacterium SG8_13]
MNRNNSSSQPDSGRFGSLGTFAGVFTPSILTILGIILFLRLGYVVGSAGLGRALLILLLANGISVLTTFSLSAIATNLKVKGGGDYYLISRTLGMQFGGSIGIVLYLAQSVSIAFYCIGFGEVVAALLGGGYPLMPQIVAASAVVFLFVFAWLGADVATRFQYVVMTILGLALVSFFAGGVSRWDGALLTANWSAPASPPPFWVIFAIFFPAVTGFTQGVSMSGDLKDAGRSLPLGTFLAVGLSIGVYFLAAVVFAASVDQQVLISDYSSMQRVAVVDFLITAGVIAATLSSAMASFLGAPRILQSLAADRIFPFLNVFAQGYGPAGNPRRGVLLSAAIAFVTIALGNLNLVAPVVSMFFLVSYGLLNYATYFEARTASPSFRPRFRWFDHRASLAGAIASLAAMVAIDPVAGIVALAILFAIHQYLKRTAGPARWADSQRSWHLQRIRHHLLAAAAEPEHPRYWRPQILLFSDDSHRRERLLTFASWVQGESGFTTVVRILEGRGLKMLKAREEAQLDLNKTIQKNGIDAFPLVISAPDMSQAIQTLVQASGIGPVQANTILMNWIENAPRPASRYLEVLFSRNLRTVHRFGCNIVLLATEDDKWDALAGAREGEKRIDVWWWADATSRLMLLLAYLLTRSQPLDQAKIRVIASSNQGSADEALESLQKTIEEVRIDARAHIVATLDTGTLVEESADAALVFIPFQIRNDKPLDPFGGILEETIFTLPTCALVMAAEDIDLEAEPEEGKAAEMAEALDAVADAETRVKYAEKDFEKAAAAFESIRGNLQQMLADPKNIRDEAGLNRLMKAVSETEEKLGKAHRRFLREKTKADDAAREAEALGVTLIDKEAEDGQNKT